MNLNSKNLFFTINYTDNRLEPIASIVMHILNDIIVTTNRNTPYNITVYFDDTMKTTTLGLASWETRHIWLNTNNIGKMILLNEVLFDLNVSVLLHEILHTVGLIGGSRSTYKYINYKSDNPPSVYTGPNAIAQYINVLKSNNKDTTGIIYLPIEDDFGDGTADSHLEEGIDENNSREPRIIDGITYPIIPNEIMTGFLGTSNYITPITLGLLQDTGFTVNYGSQYVLSKGQKLNFI
jgi:hypothetical protein